MAELQMTPETERDAKKLLVKALDGWFEQMAVRGIPLPYVGENVSEIMAEAGIAVLRGMDDSQKDLIEDGLLVD